MSFVVWVPFCRFDHKSNKMETRHPSCLRIILAIATLGILGFVGLLLLIQLHCELGDYYHDETQLHPSYEQDSPQILPRTAIIVAFLFGYGLFMVLIGYAILSPSDMPRLERKHAVLFVFTYGFTVSALVTYVRWLLYYMSCPACCILCQTSEIRVIAILYKIGEVVCVVGGAFLILLVHLGAFVIVARVVLTQECFFTNHKSPKSPQNGTQGDPKL